MSTLTSLFRLTYILFQEQEEKRTLALGVRISGDYTAHLARCLWIIHMSMLITSRHLRPIENGTFVRIILLRHVGGASAHRCKPRSFLVSQ